MATADCSCPPEEAAAVDMKAWRFVFDEGPACTENSFLPPAVMKPKRKFKSAPDLCDALALSLFVGANEARKFWLDLGETQNVAVLLGEYLASGRILSVDGLAGPVDEVGHFNLFEAEQATLYSVFVVEGKLP